MSTEAEVEERKHPSTTSSPGGGVSGPRDPAATEAVFQKMREQTKARQAATGGV